MVAQVKPTTKNSSAIKVGRNPNNLPAESYAAKGVKSPAAGSYVANTELSVDPNTLSAKNMTRLTGAPRVSMGDPGANKIKTTGIETRGNGAATKGRKAYGPLA